jgi:predicted DNA-binding protein
MNEEKISHIDVRLPLSLKNRFKILATKKNTSMKQIINDLVKNFVEENEQGG